ncbi:MAG: flavodoxin family protein [Syntrophales bacterium]|nr:flavodoxin family protein [Syntrophales bacterium]
MRILAFNGSPRKGGNTSTIIGVMLDGARSKGAETEEVRLHDIDMKGCMGCLSCRKNPGFCKQKDDLSPYLEAIKGCAGMIVGCPIYMYRISGQAKMFVDRIYSLYANRPEGGYSSMVPPGKTYALVTSQGAPGVEHYNKSFRYLAGMTGSGLGMTVVGHILHANSHENPAAHDKTLLEAAYEMGRQMVLT